MSKRPLKDYSINIIRDNKKPLEYVNKTSIYNKQPFETAKQYWYLSLYLNAGIDRSIASIFSTKTEKKEGLDDHQKIIKICGIRQALGLSSKFEWVKRAAAYDDYMAIKLKKTKEKEIRKLRTQHAQASNMSSQLFNVVTQLNIKGIFNEIKKNPDMSLVDVNKLMKKAGLSHNDLQKYSDRSIKTAEFAYGDINKDNANNKEPEETKNSEVDPCEMNYDVSPEGKEEMCTLLAKLKNVK
jgi:hypothetical protein